MSHIKIIAERANGKASAAEEGLRQNIRLRVIPHPIHPMAEGHTDYIKTYVIEECS
jgi:hypothetical protein